MRFKIIFIPLLAGLCCTSLAFAQQVPSSADTSRIDRELIDKDVNNRVTPVSPAPTLIPAVPQSDTPSGAGKINFVLKSIIVEGVHVYTQKNLQSSWQNDLDKQVSLQRVYEIADAITRRYRDDGYILSRAYVPAQEISAGIVHINVVEGYIADVQYKGVERQRLLDDARQKLTSYHPLNVRDLERQMLLLDDLEGYNFHAVLQPLTAVKNDQDQDGGVTLAIIADKDSPVHGTASLDNAGSRYVGPWIANTDFSFTNLPFLPFQRTDLSLATSVPVDELKLIGIHHAIPLTSDGLSMTLDGGYSLGRPGYVLKPLDLETRTLTMGAGFDYAVIRQRQENLYLHGGFDVRNSLTDIENNSLTKDKIRALRIGVRYDQIDHWAGYNQMAITASRGLNVLGASSKGDTDLSRSGGRPDFSKVEASVYRTQYLGKKWSLFGGAQGQISRDSLLSSEEFGYGGGNFGRAFDPSEILGDTGFSAMAELRYEDLHLNENSKLQPFVFYDFGKVWNNNIGQSKKDSGASIGGGLRLQNMKLPNLSLTFAQPLTRSQDTPQRGNGKNFRVLMGISYGF